jgi:hypothetical protein
LNPGPEGVGGSSAWIYTDPNYVASKPAVYASSGPSPGTNILDHSMASNIDELTSNVITRINTFSSTDSKVYSWLSLGNVGAGIVDFYWYSPNGNIYKKISIYIPSNPNGDYWPSYNVWSYLDIAGYITDLPGNWHVDVYLDGQKLLTEQFALDGTPSNVIQNGYTL